jgi:hypothetical protein
MNEPQWTQNIRLAVLGVSQLQHSIVREGTTGTCGASRPRAGPTGSGEGWGGEGLRAS